MRRETHVFQRIGWSPVFVRGGPAFFLPCSSLVAAFWGLFTDSQSARLQSTRLRASDVQAGGELRAEVFAEVFLCSECPSKTSPKTSWKTSPQTSRKKTSPRTSPVQNGNFAQNFALQKPFANEKVLKKMLRLTFLRHLDSSQDLSDTL